ncbi:MAG: hypothetical protein LRZ85_05050 [Alphaproteobacteria bacterium]|nr:hypothetical protein [Alphaproteobacteria bacterium]MCD8520336.1 hypothetical protein [Alphaproteobacteria bacterium]
MALDKIMEILGVDHVLTPYETQPWMFYHEGEGITCSAEIRMGGRGTDVEAEVQFIKDHGDEDEGEEEGQGDQSGGGEELPPEPRIDPMTGMPIPPEEDMGPPVLEQLKAGKPYQVMFMRILPLSSGDNEWATRKLFVKGKDFENDFHGWEEKGCEFFRACIEAMQMGEIPDIEELIETVLADSSWGGGRRGRIGRKSPKIKPANLLGMKSGM